VGASRLRVKYDASNLWTKRGKINVSRRTVHYGLDIRAVSQTDRQLIT